MIVRLLMFFTYYGLTAPAASEVRRVKAQEGRSVTLQPETPKLIGNEDFIWTFIPSKSLSKLRIAQSQMIKGEVHTEYRGHFKDCLQLNRKTGSLTIREITISQSGLYHLEITEDNGVQGWDFNCTVYAPVSTPDISKGTFQSKPPSRSGRQVLSSPRCQVLCSVRYGRDVSLHWYTDNESLSSTSSPDANNTLSLRLELDDQDNAAYSCVSANPVSNRTTSLDITAVCSSGQQPDSLLPRSYGYLLLTISMLMSAVVVTALYWKRKRRTPKTCTGEK